MSVDFEGPVKIKDGFFVGDDISATDLDFIVTNKVTHIINCAASLIPNHWEQLGVSYLTFCWGDDDRVEVLDEREQAVDLIFTFIENAINIGGSILVHSVEGKGRCMLVTAAYFMRRFRWSYAKALQFLEFRRPGLQMKTGYIEQLNKYEQRLQRKTGEALSNSWKFLQIDDAENDYDEVIVTNTFINAQPKNFAHYDLVDNSLQARKLKWLDEGGSKQGLVECAGLAASVKTNHGMNNTFTSMSRAEEQAASARGPHNPLAISQPLKLKSLLKKSPVEYILVKPNVKEKYRRPMSSSTVGRRPTRDQERKMNSSFVAKDTNPANPSMGRSMMNNFMLGGGGDDEHHDKENGPGRMRASNIPLPSSKMVPVHRPRSNQSSDLKTKILNKRTTGSTFGYSTISTFGVPTNPNSNKKNTGKELREQVKTFQNFSNPWANSTFKSMEPADQAPNVQPMIKSKKTKKNSMTSSDRRILSKINTNSFTIRGNSPGARLIYK